MRLDTANRSFAGLHGAALVAGMFVFCGAVGCVLVVLVASRVGSDGLDALTSGPHSLWPAAVFMSLVGAGAGVGASSLIRQARGSRRLATGRYHCPPSSPRPSSGQGCVGAWRRSCSRSQGGASWNRC